MSEFLKLVELAKQLETQNAEVYDIYAEITDHFGLMQLLRALRAGIDTHCKTLDKFLSHRAGEPSVDEAKLARFNVDTYDVERSFDASMSYADFLCMIMSLEERLETFYEELSHMVLSEDDRGVFRRLAADQQKHLWLARSRRDLEELEAGCADRS